LHVAQGIALTLYLTAGSFLVATFLGLFIGLARISRRPWISNIAAFYIEFIRGIPMLVFIFTVALVLVPDFTDLIGQPSRVVPQAMRGAIALSLFYAAFIAEVFRAGIQSVSSTQREAGLSLGLTETLVMRLVILPQAVRNMLPALGNDLISLMKDTSLISVLAVRELTQMARLYSGASFRFRESFFILMVIYVVLTLSLSLLLRWYERRIAIPGR
jgi:polar amino acid transport system permease protein